MRWRTEEVEKLRALMAKGYGARRAARHMHGRSVGSVTGKIDRLRRDGVDHPVAWTRPQEFPSRFSVRFDLDTIEQLDRRAHKQGVSRVEVIRELVEWALEEFA
jgi:hypothetical protein